jgi:hypothetical protein
MKTIHGLMMQATTAAGALALSMLVATPTLGTGGPGLIVRAAVARGNEVVFVVTNRSAETRTGTVSTRLLTLRGEVAVTAPVTASAGQTVTIRVVAPDRVLDEEPLGVVVDDGVPF